MISIDLIRTNPQLVIDALANRGESNSLEDILSLDESRRKNIIENDELKRHRNEVSKSIGERRANGQDIDPSEMEVMKTVGEKISSLDNSEYASGSCSLKASQIILASVRLRFFCFAVMPSSHSPMKIASS